MTEHIEHSSRRPLGVGKRGNLALVGAGLLALGGAAGAVVMAETRPSVSMAPATPVAIRSLSSGGIVTIRGRVAEIYGNKFIMADASGRALVDTGREGDDRQLVADGQPITVQGRSVVGSSTPHFLSALITRCWHSARSPALPAAQTARTVRVAVPMVLRPRPVPIAPAAAPAAK